MRGEGLDGELDWRRLLERDGEVDGEGVGGELMMDLLVTGLTEGGMGLVRLGVLISGETESVARRLVGVRGDDSRSNLLCTVIWVGGDLRW